MNSRMEFHRKDTEEKWQRVLDEHLPFVELAQRKKEEIRESKRQTILKVDAEHQQRKNNLRKLIEHVKIAKDRLENDKVTALIRTLPIQSKLVLAACISLRRVPAYTGEIYNLYKFLCQEVSVDVLAQRRVTDLISELGVMGLINAADISKGRYGRTKEVTLAVLLIEEPRISVIKDYDALRLSVVFRGDVGGK